MAVKQRTIAIVGCGPGGLDYVTPAALKCIEQADVLAGTKRLLDAFPGSRAKRLVIGGDLEAGMDQIATFRRQRVAVLVTGDTGLCSLARHVIRRFGRETCEVIPGISSVQVAFARIGADWLGVRIINAHHGIPDIAPASLAGTRKLAILGGHLASRPWMAEVAAVLGRDYRVYVCENLTLPDERVRTILPKSLRNLKAAALHVMIMIHKEEL